MSAPGTTEARPAAAPPPGALAPFRHRAFALMWLAVVIANTGTWMRDVGLGWLMTDLAASPAWVSAVQAAAALPVFLLALPAGALADLLDRRRLLFATQAGLMGLALVLALLASAGLVTPVLLLALTLAAGIGTALANPAWQTIVPQLVPRGELRQAVALNSLGFNISRAIGPALGGAVVAAAGVTAAFLADALSFVAILAVLAWWRPPAPHAAAAPPEHMRGALAAGLRYARRSDALRRVLLRAVLFFAFASAPWALMPLVARQVLGGGADLYGAMLGAIGAGAVLGAFLLGPLRRLVGGGDALVLLGTAGIALAGASLALVPVPLLGVLACFVLGIGWIMVLTTLNVAAQSSLPDWVRGRGLALYIAIQSGAMAGGSLVWGGAAQLGGIPAALLGAALLGLLAGIWGRRIALPEGGDDLTPGEHMPAHGPAEAATPGNAGPVLVQVEYEVAPEDRIAFLAALDALGEIRRRDGAQSWWRFEEPGAPFRVVEAFLVRDWAEHERMHARSTRADHALHAAANAFDRRPGGPVVRHLVGIGTA